MYKTIQSLGIIFLFIALVMTSIVVGYDENNYEEKLIIENFNSYDVSELSNFKYGYGKLNSSQSSILSEKENIQNFLLGTTNDPKYSVWPMYCHDVRHTGKSSYSTTFNPGNEIWWIKINDCFVEGSAVIDNNDLLYFGSWCDFYALDLINQSIVWSYDTGGNIESGPAIDKNGIIYIGNAYAINSNCLYAFYPDGSVKWTFITGGNIHSSPAISANGTIYFGNDVNGPPLGGYINALYPNGTINWRYKTNHFVHSSPAIGTDGTVYCGSHDGNMYALYPDNGTLKWKHKTEGWVARGACIDDKGIIYFGSWDGHLYACYPNGNLKWKASVGAVTTPVIGNDGTIYVGSDKLSAVNPDDGSIFWQYDVPGRIATGNPCISSDGTIYCGTADQGYIVAINPDGTERWKHFFGGECFFAPVIDENGIVYIGSNNDQEIGGGERAIGYLHVFGKLDQNAPTVPIIGGPSKGTRNERYNYTIKSTSPIGNDIYYWIEWGDLIIEEWIGPYNSGEEVKISHSWSLYGDYLIRIKVKDVENIWGPWSEFEIKISNPRTITAIGSSWLRFQDMFSILQRLLTFIK